MGTDDSPAVRLFVDRATAVHPEFVLADSLRCFDWVPVESVTAPLPHWNTVHRYHVGWSRDGTWERIADRLRTLVRVNEGRDPDPSVGIIAARTLRGAATVTRSTRGYDAGKKISGRKTFGVVDSLGLLLGIVVVAASVSDNIGGIAAMTRANPKSRRVVKLFSDGGFKTTFKKWCHSNHISAEVINRIHAHRFEVLPKRWIVERTWSWLMNNRRLQIDYERDPIVTEAAHRLRVRVGST